MKNIITNQLFVLADTESDKTWVFIPQHNLLDVEKISLEGSKEEKKIIERLVPVLDEKGKGVIMQKEKIEVSTFETKEPFYNYFMIFSREPKFVQALHDVFGFPLPERITFLLREKEYDEAINELKNFLDKLTERYERLLGMEHQFLTDPNLYAKYKEVLTEQEAQIEKLNETLRQLKREKSSFVQALPEKYRKPYEGFLYAKITVKKGEPPLFLLCEYDEKNKALTCKAMKEGEKHG